LKHGRWYWHKPLVGRDGQKTQHGIETPFRVVETPDEYGRDGQKTQHGIETLRCIGDIFPGNDVATGRKPSTGLKLRPTAAARGLVNWSRRAENPARD